MLAAAFLAVTGATAGPARAATAVPAGFSAQSDTWISAARGWVLGTAPCASGTCTDVLTTGNGGRTWRTAGQVPAPLAPSGEPGVTEIRFADRQHGWAYGPSFYATADGGRTWQAQPLPGGGQEALTVAAEAGRVYLAVSPCAIGGPDCTSPTTLWRSGPAGHRWRQVPVTLPATGEALGVLVSLHGRTAYVAVPGPAPAADTFFATTDGRHWSARPSPCSKDDDLALDGVAAISGRAVALLCTGDAGMSMSVKEVFRSADTGMTTTSAGTLPADGIPTALAAAPDGTLLADSSAAGGDFLYRNAGGTTWQTVVNEAGNGWNDLTFAGNAKAFVVQSPADTSAGETGTLLGSRDGGQDWSPVALAPASAG